MNNKHILYTKTKGVFMLDFVNKMSDFLTSKKMRIIDFIGAVLCLLWAGKLYYYGEDFKLYLVVGLIGLVLAYFNFTKRMFEFFLPKNNL